MRLTDVRTLPSVPTPSPRFTLAPTGVAGRVALAWTWTRPRSWPTTLSPASGRPAPTPTSRGWPRGDPYTSTLVGPRTPSNPLERAPTGIALGGGAAPRVNGWPSTCAWTPMSSPLLADPLADGVALADEVAPPVADALPDEVALPVSD